MRSYLDQIYEYKNTPIWITEIGLHVGYDDWAFDNKGNITPVGTYHWDKMSDYLVNLLDWLESESDTNQIEKWFFLETWIDIVNLRPGSGYMGIVFFEGSEKGSNLNCLGEIYRSRALSLERLKCDSNGNVIPE